MINSLSFKSEDLELARRPFSQYYCHPRGFLILYRFLVLPFAHFSKGTVYPGGGFYEWGNRTGRLADSKWYLKDNIQLKESFLVDLNTGGSFVYDFDLVWEIKKVYLKYFLTPKFALVAFKKVIKDFKFLKP